RSSGWKTPPRSRHTAPGTPSWLGQTGGPTTFILIRRIETAQIQLGHRIQHEENHIAFGQLGVGAMSLMPVALGLPGPIRFPGGLAHQWSPHVCVTIRLNSREESLSPFTRLTATIDWYTGSFSDRLLGAILCTADEPET